MKKQLNLTGLFISLFFSFQTFGAKNSDSPPRTKTPNVTLSKCVFIFGIPSTTSEYDGNNILFTTVAIYVGNKQYKANAEYRNSPIGAGQVIYLVETYPASDLAKITPDAIDKIDFTISIHQGSGTQKVRAQVILEFSDGNKLASGSPDPAPEIFIKAGASVPKDGTAGVFTYSSPKPFFDKSKVGDDFFNKHILRVPVN
jgi:hypothetical protein